MQGAAKRIERELEVSNRHAHSTAALVGAAMNGKLPSFEKAFGRKLQPAQRQSADVLEANLRAMAIAWGAKL